MNRSMKFKQDDSDKFVPYLKEQTIFEEKEPQPPNYDVEFMENLDEHMKGNYGVVWDEINKKWITECLDDK